MGIVDWFKRQTFDGKIQRHVGQVSSSNKALVNAKLSIDLLESKEPQKSGSVRIGITMSSFASYESLGIVLTKNEAKELAELLLAASSND